MTSMLDMESYAAVSYVTPEIAAQRKVLEVAGDDEELAEKVFLGYLIGCEAYAKLGPNALVSDVIDLALAYTNPAEEVPNWEEISADGSWTPNDLGDTVSRWAHIGAIESWWADRGIMVSETDDLWHRRQLVTGDVLDVLGQLMARKAITGGASDAGVLK